MLERTFGYKGPIPRISYSRYMSIDKINVFSLDAHEKIYEESGSGFKKLPCSRLNKELFECDKVKKKGMSSPKLLKNEGPSRAGDKNHTQGKTHLSPPPQGFQATSGNRTQHRKERGFNAPTQPKIGPPPQTFQQAAAGISSSGEQSTNDHRTDRGSCSALECSRELCGKNYDFPLSSEKVWLNFDNDSVYMKPRTQQWKKRESLNSDKQDQDKEMQRQKIINSWMQFFG